MQRFGLACNTKPVDAGADAGGGAASFKEVYGILDMKGKAELKRRMAEDQSMVVSEAAKLEAQIKALELGSREGSAFDAGRRRPRGSNRGRERCNRDLRLASPAPGPPPRPSAPGPPRGRPPKTRDDARAA